MHISTYKEGMMGYIINSETSEDVRKILLLNGYAKLGK